MRAIALLFLLGACQPMSSRGGIVSTNPCADAILLRLVAPARIAAISRYSQDPAATSIPLALANRLRATGGTAEEVIALRPSLVLASSFTQPATREAYARAGLNAVYLDSPTTVTASIAQVEQVAGAVGEPARGSALATAIRLALRPPPVVPQGISQPAALLYIAGDLANGSGTLLDELLNRAGFRDAAADYGLAHTGTLPAELLIAHPPDIVITSGGPGRTVALRRRLLPGTPEASYPRNLVNCGGPAIPAALARLRAIRATLP